MLIQQNIPLGPKTTMRIGGSARWYTELLSKKNVEEAYLFAHEKNIPLVVLGAGSNTVFADGVIEALVVRVKAEKVSIPPPLPNPPPQGEGNLVTVQSGKILASLINELAEESLDLSPFTGIPGTIGGAIFGNAGQGPKGAWIGSFVESVEAFVDGQWKTFRKEECGFEYRESVFKRMAASIIWSVTLSIPTNPAEQIKQEIDRLIQKRIATQPHLKTAGSCFKGVHGTPAWKCIDGAGLRGKKCGSVQIAEKHANFLLNTGKGTFEDAKKIVELIRTQVPEKLEVEMRFIDEKGNVVF